MQFVDIQKYLPLVSKPSRYIDHEINAVRRDPRDYGVKVCLAFPDVYEVGISHLGLKILYSIINQRNDAMADRVYLPWTDLLEIMKQEKLPLFGIESHLAVKDFDLLGITLQSELTYSNVLELLSASGIPLFCTQRVEADPIIMAGGPCTVNPLPLKEFIDVFFIGEAEEAISEIVDVLAVHPGRNQRLQALSQIPGVYIPAIHDVQRRKQLDFRIKARKFAGFGASSHLHSPQILSWQLATHNRYVAEIMRGCSRGCRFCQAGYIYRPVRERQPGDILKNLLEEVKLSGWDEVGLMSLSSADYTCITPLLLMLWQKLDARRSSVSLPSLRVDSLDEELVGLLRDLGREGLTIAPEAGSQRLRDVINKNLSEEEILKGVQIAQELGWQRIKLYFMIGLPTETEEDIEGIGDLISKINKLGKGRMQINVTLSPFVPKPFTPFERCAFADPEVLLQRAQKIKWQFGKNRNIKIKYHDIQNSTLEALLARGDERMAKVLYGAWAAGARFDGWNECFDFGLWQAALDQQGLTVSELSAKIAPQDRLIWEFIDYGVCQTWLQQEYDKALKAQTTVDCRDICSLCGVCDSTISTQNAKPLSEPVFEPQVSSETIYPSCDNARQYRYRVFYRKQGVLRFISHLDWMRMLFRMVSRSNLDTVFTQGFSPHPKVSLAPPLPLGVESKAEYFDVSFYAKLAPEQIMHAYRESPLPGFDIYEVQPLSSKGIIPQGEKLSYAIPAHLIPAAGKACLCFAERNEWHFEKATAKRQKSYDLKQIIYRLSCSGGALIIDKSLIGPSVWDIMAELLSCPKEDLFEGILLREDWIW